MQSLKTRRIALLSFVWKYLYKLAHLDIANLQLINNKYSIFYYFLQCNQRVALGKTVYMVMPLHSATFIWNDGIKIQQYSYIIYLIDISMVTMAFKKLYFTTKID